MSALDERLARVALNWLTEPGDPRVARLVEDLGAVRVHEHLLAERDVHGLHTDVAARLEGFDVHRHLDEAEKTGARFVVPGEEEWPTRLDALRDAPVLNERGGVPVGLWVRGPLDLAGLTRSVAVVGSRSATTYGTQVAAEIAHAVARAGSAVVSGAALGIDQAAHRGALAGNGATVAVLACGVDRIYPAANRALVEHVLDVGAVVSEAAPGREPTRIRFLSRNRVIAALSEVTVVAEAALRSGALSTATWCERLNRPLLGVPGPVTSAQSQGVHERLRLGRAHLVTCGEDVLEYVGRPGEHLTDARHGETIPRDRLPWRQKQVLEAFPAVDVVDAPALARAAGIGIREVQGALLRLGAHGWVVQEGEGWRLGRHG
ncbi:DNA-processing protein DprA [Nocardioides yefusunii]|uniref:DNA-processing protein DprA n=1 Tax=Nocardioides yefusunii TaxID=2500546 RepID=A0ABW1QVE5_9ACTN|nr:DNA-processing protein DprA [Nocardioides yefusunii]